MTSSVYDDRTYTMLCTDENGNIEEDRLAYFKTSSRAIQLSSAPTANSISDYVPSGKEGLPPLPRLTSRRSSTTST